MIIRLIEQSDDIASYLECVGSLNSNNALVSSVEQIGVVVGLRPTNVLTFVGILDDGKIVSTATIIMEKKLRYQRLCCHIEDVAVRPEYRGKGYGKEMMDFCLKVAKANNCYKVKLNCSEKLISFYESCGFKENSVGMVLDLSNKESVIDNG